MVGTPPDAVHLVELADALLVAQDDAGAGVPCHRALLAVRSGYFDAFFRFSGATTLQLPYDRSLLTALVAFCATDRLDADHTRRSVASCVSYS